MGVENVSAQTIYRIALRLCFGNNILMQFPRILRLACCLAFFSLANPAQTAEEKLNVIVILADDMGYGDVGCFGNAKFKTPAIDRMAAEGAKLTDFYAACPYCAPSRVSLLTGRYQFRSGLTKNPAPDESKESDTRGISNSEITLGNVFQKAGYRTAMIGKWHLGHKPEFAPTRHGFNEYLGILYSHDMRPVQLMDGPKVVEYPVLVANLTKKYTARALQFIEKNKAKPFFLYFAHALPHKPLAASEDFYKKSGGGLYGDAVQEVDRSVGEVLNKLKELGLDKNTLVIFTSDNGPWFGGSTGGLRGMKGTTWEGGIREPFIAWWPGKIHAGRVSHEPAIMMDIFTTSLAAAGLKIPFDRYIDGKNILPLLTSDASTPHDALFSMQGDDLATVRSGKWKLHMIASKKQKIIAPDDKWIDKRAPDGVTIIAPYEQAHPSQYPGLLSGDETKSGSLFDLEKDPAEQHDVAKQHPEVVVRLRVTFDAMNKQVEQAAAQRHEEKK
ncbi:MAG: arylsulfatase [Verrucomicrobiales bacterium]|nr:arylsulfatase [Verrucomicrobiales bacterium]